MRATFGEPFPVPRRPCLQQGPSYHEGETVLDIPKGLALVTLAGVMAPPSEAASERAQAQTSARDEAARELWSEHYPRLAGWCASLVGDVDTAHDIAADSFERLLAKWSKVDDPRAYLYVIATNRIRDHWRRERRDRDLTGRIQNSRPELTSPAADPWLRDLVLALPDRLRRPVLLHYYADLPVAEVAHALHRPVGSIKRMLSEGRAALLKQIEDQS